MSSTPSPLSLTLDKQVNLLISHGLMANDEREKAEIAERLCNIGFFRMDEYTWPFRQLIRDQAGNIISNQRSPHFKDKTHIRLIWETYLFDRRLRILLLDAIERFELSMRSRITQILVEAAGHDKPHNDTSLLPGFASKLEQSGHNPWSTSLDKLLQTSPSERIQNMMEGGNITGIADLPLAAVMELTTLGSLKTLYEALQHNLQASLAASMNLSTGFVTSSFILLHQVRNKCAHHSRIWNIQWSKQKTPNKAFRKPYFNHPLRPEWNSFLDPLTRKWIIPNASSPTPVGTQRKSESNRQSVHTRSTAFVFFSAASGWILWRKRPIGKREFLQPSTTTESYSGQPEKLGLSNSGNITLSGKNPNTRIRRHPTGGYGNIRESQATHRPAFPFTLNCFLSFGRISAAYRLLAWQHADRASTNGTKSAKFHQDPGNASGPR